MKIDERLIEMGIILPQAAKPLAAYVPGLKSGEYIYTSGQLPIQNGELVYRGKLGEDLSVEEGQEAARLCTLNSLAIIKDLIGNWDNLIRIVKITGYVQSAPNFYDQPQVINGASQLLEQIFGEAGKHARSAVGAASLPLNAACEIEMVVKVK